MADKIKFFSLGGLDEYGKNLSVIEINDDIYIFDAGIKFPDKRVPGVDCIVPNHNYLIENSSRVKAYIISHAHDDQMGAIPYLYKKIPAPIYCSKITAALIINKTVLYGLKQINYDFHYVESGIYNINNREFVFISMTHSVPGTLAVAMDTDQGYIVYTPDFILDYGALGENKINFKYLNYLTEKKVLLLLCSSNSADKPGHTSPNHRITPHIQSFFQECNGRIFITVYTQNIYNYREILDLGIKFNKKIIFLTEDCKTLFGDEMCEKYLSIPSNNKATINEINRIAPKDILVIIDGTGEEIFKTVISLANGELLSNISFNETDTFILNTPSVPATETIAIEAVDSMYKAGVNVYNLSRKVIYSMNAREEDIKMLLSVLEPKYYLPIKGDFSQLMANARIALSMNLGYNHNNIFVFDNGMVLNIENGIAKPDFNSIIENGDIMVDGIGVGNVVESVINERIKMATDGVIIIGAVVSTKNKEIITLQDCQMRGFVFLKDSENIVRQINAIFEDALHVYISNYHEGAEDEFMFKISEKIFKYVRKETKKQPLVLPKIIDIDKE